MTKSSTFWAKRLQNSTTEELPAGYITENLTQVHLPYHWVLEVAAMPPSEADTGRQGLPFSYSKHLIINK
jgi:hypothetical protein